MNSSLLHLNLHHEYLAPIATAAKRIEYRRRTPYWRRRLEDRDDDAIQFRNAYAKETPVLLVEFLDDQKTDDRG